MSAGSDPAVATNLAGLLASSAHSHPRRAAIVDDRRAISYAELEERCARAAGTLEQAGARRGTRVALLLPNGAPFVEAYYGALHLGATVVPLNPLLKRDEIDLRLAHSGASILVTSAERASELAALTRSLSVRVIDPTSLAKSPPVSEIAAVDGRDTGVVLYTSGTTADARAVELTHAGLRSTALALGSALAVNHGDVVFGAAPLAHVFGQCAVLNMSVAAGASIAMLGRFEAETALDLLARHAVTVFLGVPTMCLELLRAAESSAAVPQLRVAHVGASPLATDTLRLFADRFACPVLEGYGLTEASGVVTTHRLDRRVKPGSVGQATEGTDLRIDGAPIGEILVRSRGVMRGYLGNERATRETISDEGWLKTGDIGYLDHEDYLFLVDRKKDVIIRGGYTIYPREIEEILYRHPNVHEAVVIGVPDARLGEEVVALVVPDAHPCDVSELQSLVRDHVAAYKYPRLVLAVDTLPHSPSGKIERRRLDRHTLAQHLEAHKRSTAY
jgi:long-chain acyl-CoA synthetase